MNRDVWLAMPAHLQPVADFQAQVLTALASIPTVCAVIPNWKNYVREYENGIPLLGSSGEAIDLRPAERPLALFLEQLEALRLPEPLARERRELGKQMRCEAGASHRALEWLLGNDDFEPAHPGLLRYLGWTVLSKYLAPLVDAFGEWRDEDRWLRSYCPTCGSAPSMSQLVAVDSGRRRLLSCGCCRTRWQFSRMGCPFCGTENRHRLTALAIEGERNLRIDYCESCRAFLKTYIGQGQESFFLADWTSLDLDLVALDRGLQRRAPSLYEL